MSLSLPPRSTAPGADEFFAPGNPAAELTKVLTLEALEDRLFRGVSQNLGGISVFGGQVLGQALAATTRTVSPERTAHSVHAYFLAAGDMAAPIVYEVEILRDGGSFSARRVQAIQHGRPIFSMIVSFQAYEEGFDHQTPMPDVPGPEGLADVGSVKRKWLATSPDIHPRIREALLREAPVEFRWVEPWNPLAPMKAPPKRNIWFRVGGRLADDALLHQCALAYCSDFNLISAALLPHEKSWYSPGMQMASLDHAMWFHRPARADEWLLYAIESPSAQGGRGLARGMIFDRAGRLIASTAQEGLMRIRQKPFGVGDGPLQTQSSTAHAAAMAGPVAAQEPAE